MSDNTNVTRQNQASDTARTNQTQDLSKKAVVPAVDIVERESGITLFADMPGVSRERLSVNVDSDNLTIEGQAEIDVPENIGLVHSEVRTPLFRRTFTLSRDLDPTRIDATLKNGVLQLHIPKAEEARPKRIEVKVT